MKVYISGKISGYELAEVIERFNQVEEHLKSKGMEPVNPLKKDIPHTETWEKHMVADIELLFTCEAIYLLSDWKQSKGAKIEKHIAETTGIKIIYEVEPSKARKREKYKVRMLKCIEIDTQNERYVYQLTFNKPLFNAGKLSGIERGLNRYDRVNAIKDRVGDFLRGLRIIN